MNARHFAVLVTALTLGCATHAAQGVYQWAVPVPTEGDKTLTAYLWIPPEAARIRGVLIGAEPGPAQDPAIRAACAAESLAIIQMRPHVDGMFNYKTGKGPEVFLRILKCAAEASGYREIAVAPFFSFGHSTSCNYASAVACWQPTRCFGVLVYKGGLVLPSYDPEADLSGIPILAVKGQFEEFGPGPSGVIRDHEDREIGWKGSRDRYLTLRGQNERMLISLIVEAGATHMSCPSSNGEYIGLFVRKAAQARIPDWPVDTVEPVKCKEVDVASGALSSGAITYPAAPKAALYADYKGDRKYTYWHADLELAQAWETFHAGKFNKRNQYVAFTNLATGKPIYSLHDLRYSVEPLFVGADVFKVAGAFLTEARDRYAVPEPPIGHADGPILFRPFGGTAAQVGPDTFRVRLDGRGGASAAIMAYHPGDAQYRYAEQPAGVKLAPPAKGKEQTLTFPPLGNLKLGGEPVKLSATSDSGLPVSYFVQCGPAIIEGDTLKVTDVPLRARFPIAVVVGAYQWGSAVEPFVQTAKTVTQTVMVEKQ